MLYVVWRRTGPREYTVDKFDTWEKALEAVKALVPDTTVTMEKLGHITNDVMITKVAK